MVGLFVAGLDGSVVNIMLPRLQSVFHTTAFQVTLVATTYLTVLAAFQLFFGRCADVFDSVTVFFFGQVFFFVGSAFCAASSHLGLLIAGRAVQGLGGAMLAASFGAAILQHFPRDRTGQIVGWTISVMGVGTIVGPPLGGFLAEYISWHWAFLLNLPLCAVAAGLLVPRLIDTARRNEVWRCRLGELDPGGSALSVVMVAAVPTTFEVAAKQGWNSLGAAAMLLVLVAALALFLRVEQGVPHPILAPDVLADSGLKGVVGIKLLVFIVLNGLLLVFPFYLTRSVGMGVGRAGWIMLALAATMALATPVVGGLADRIGSGTVITWGSVGIGALLAAALLLGPSSSTLAVVALLIGLGATLPCVMIGTTVQILHVAPEGLAGVYSAVNSVLIGLGGAMGLSLFSCLYALGKGSNPAFAGFRLALIGGLASAAAMVVLQVFRVRVAKVQPACPRPAANP